LTRLHYNRGVFMLAENALRSAFVWLIEADDHWFGGKEQDLNQELTDAWIKTPRR